MKKSLLTRIVGRPGLALEFHPGAMPVGRRHDSAAAGAAREDGDGEMGDGHGGNALLKLNRSDVRVRSGGPARRLATRRGSDV